MSAGVDASLLAFIGIAAAVIVTPGQDTALTIRNTLAGGARAGVATAAGVCAGQATWTLAASFGLTALLVASEGLFTVVRLAGAAYLVYLGAHSLVAAIRPHAGVADGEPGAKRPSLDARRALRQGLLSNLGNPKMAVFFSSLLPQFAGTGGSALAGMAALGLLFVGMTFIWLALYALVVERARAILLRGRVRRAMDAVTGAVLVAFGVRLATGRS